MPPEIDMTHEFFFHHPRFPRNLRIQKRYEVFPFKLVTHEMLFKVHMVHEIFFNLYVKQDQVTPPFVTLPTVITQIEEHMSQRKHYCQVFLWIWFPAKLFLLLHLFITVGLF